MYTSAEQTTKMSLAWHIRRQYETSRSFEAKSAVNGGCVGTVKERMQLRLKEKNAQVILL